MSVTFYCKQNGPLLFPDDHSCPAGMFDNEANYMAWLEEVKRSEQLAIDVDTAKAQAFSDLEKRMDEEIVNGVTVSIPALSVRIFQQVPDEDMELTFPFDDEARLSFARVAARFADFPKQVEDWNCGNGIHVFFDAELFNSVYSAILSREVNCRKVLAAHEGNISSCTDTACVLEALEYIMEEGWSML